MEVILAADGLSALNKKRNDRSSVCDKGEVSSSSTFCYLCYPLLLSNQPYVTSDRGHLSRLTLKNQIQMKHATGNIYHLQIHLC